MLSLAHTAFTNFITDITVDYQIIVNKPFLIVAHIGGDWVENSKKISETISDDGFNPNKSTYYLDKHGISIQYFDTNLMHFKLNADSMIDVMHNFLDSSLVPQTTFGYVKSNETGMHFTVTGDVVNFIEQLPTHGFKVETTEVSAYNYVHEVKTNFFNMFIDDQNDVLEIEIFF